MFDFKSVCPENNTGYLLWNVSILWLRKLDKELQTLNITHTQLVILVFLACLKGRNEVVTQADIANYANTDRMMTSKVLKTLEGKGMVVRTGHGRDTRAKSVHITAYGTEILLQARDLFHQLEARFFSSVKKEEEVLNASLSQLFASNR